MPRPAYIEINGQRLLWREVIELRRRQIAEARHPPQPALFEWVEDRKPACEATAALRYKEPSLLSLLAGPHSFKRDTGL